MAVVFGPQGGVSTAFPESYRKKGYIVGRGGGGSRGGSQQSTPETPTPNASLLYGSSAQREAQISAFRSAGGGSAGEQAVSNIVQQIQQQERQILQEQLKQEQIRQQQIQQQRASIVGKGSGVSFTPTTEADRQKYGTGVVTTKTTSDKITTRQMLAEFRRNPKKIITTLAEKRAQVLSDPGVKILSEYGAPLVTAETVREKGFKDWTNQKLERFERDVGRYEAERESYSKEVEDFNKRVEGRQLSEEEFIQASQKRSELEKRRVQIEQQEQTLLAREERIKQTVANYDKDLIKERKKAPLVERLSVQATRGAGDIVGTAVIATKAVGRPGETYREIESGIIKDQPLKRLKEEALTDPLGAGIQLASGYVLTMGIGAVAGKVVGKVANVVRAAKTPTKVTVSVGNIKAVRAPNNPNVWRVTGEAVGEVRDISTGKLLGTTRTATDTVTVSAKTSQEAVQTYSKGVVGSLSQAGADVSNMKVGISTIQGRAEFSQGAVEGLTSGVGYSQIDKVAEGVLKRTTIKTAPTVDLVGLRLEQPVQFGKAVKTPSFELILKKAKRGAPQAVVSESAEISTIDAGNLRRSVVDSRSAIVRDISPTLSPTGKIKQPRLPLKPSDIGEFALERDVVTMIQKQVKQPDPFVDTFTKSSTTTRAVRNLGIDLKAVEQSGTTLTKAGATQATKNLQRQIRRQSVSDAILKRAPTSRTTQISAQRTSQLNKLLFRTGVSSVAGLSTQTRTRTIFSPINVSASSFGLASASKFNQSTAQVSLLKQIQRAEQSLSFGQFIPTPVPTPTTLGEFGFGFPFPSRKQRGGFLTRTGKRKAIKPLSGYTASLAAAALQRSPLKVTRKQFEQLQKRTYLGTEARPVLQIVPDKKYVKNFQKQLEAVQF